MILPPVAREYNPRHRRERVTEPASSLRFREMAARPERDVDLAEASLLIAVGEYPDLDPGHYLARLDEMGMRLRDRASAGDSSALVAALNRLLFDEEGFHGNTDNYYDPRNSFLNDVLDRRTGIPISLCTVYMEVARRAGLELDGVGLPGHFVVSVKADTSPLLVDPFNRGTVLTLDDCQRRLDRIYSGRMRLEPGMLAPCTRKAILARMLRNLKGIYVKAGDYERALRAVEMLRSLDPDDPDELRDRGVLHAALDCYATAADDLESYLARVPRCAEAPQLAAKVAELRGRAARVN
jgi:regulator of sirC expression with transglutaminase-like and TPR domain